MKYITILAGLFLTSCASYQTKHADYLHTQTILIDQKTKPSSNDRQPSSDTNLSEGFVTLVYHQLDMPKLPTYISPDKFKKQIQYLIENNFNIISLPQALRAMEEGTLPDKAIVITFDDAFKSIKIAHNILQAFTPPIPYTIFVSTKTVGGGHYLGWEDLKRLVESGKVTIGNHSHAHPSLPSLEHIDDARIDVLTAQDLIEKHLGIKAKYFAYPYGESTPAIENLVDKLGFEYAFAQMSGAIGPHHDPLTLPRIPINEGVRFAGKTGTGFELKAATLPLPINLIDPDIPLYDKGSLDEVVFALHPKAKLKPNFTCYYDGQSKQLEVIPVENMKNTFKVSINQNFTHRRPKLTCTQWAAPANDNTPTRFHWQTLLFIDKSFDLE